jgi:hypothetical protein
MLNQDDLIRLAFTPDLTAAASAYARQQLASPSHRSPRASRAQFRQLVIDKAVELAFRRCLDAQHVPYETAPGTTFGSHGSYYLLLGGWRCNFQSCWIDQPEIVRQVQSQPECLLHAGALLSSERVVAWVPGDRDLYIFAYVTGQTPAQPNRSLNGDTIYLAGYISHPEYARRSRRLASGSPVFPAIRTRQMTRILYVSELHPLQELLDPLISGS